MKRTVLAGIAVLTLACPALAQTTVVTPPAPGASATITLAPAQRTRIKQYVVERRVRPVIIREGVAVGATIPADVELVVVPSEWGPELSPYRYLYAGERVFLVEPSSRRVLHVID
jgi:hypothetical protein